MKTYSSKANANRAAKTQGLNPVDYAVYQNDNVWVLEVIGNDLLAVDNKEAWELEAEKEAANIKLLAEAKAQLDAELKTEWLAAFVPYNTMMLLPAPKAVAKSKKEQNAAIPHISVIDNPVKQVWVIADNMWGERRKDIIAACVAAGIAYNTARTQYQAFYKVKSQEEAK